MTVEEHARELVMKHGVGPESDANGLIKGILGLVAGSAARDDEGLHAATFSPWLEAECQQRCGWHASGDVGAAARLHVAETGHETAVVTHASVHYTRALAAQDEA